MVVNKHLKHKSEVEESEEEEEDSDEEEKKSADGQKEDGMEFDNDGPMSA